MNAGINLPIRVWRKALEVISEKTGFRFLLLKWLNKLMIAELEDMKKAITAHGCIPFSLHSSVSLFLDYPLYYDICLKRVKEDILRAKIMGCHDYTMHPPMLVDPELATSCRDQLFVDFLIEIDRFIKRENINLRLSLENTFDAESAYCKPDELFNIVLEVQSKNIGLCMDTGHLNMLVPSIEEALSDIPYGMIQATHLHDNGGGKDEHNIPGKGNINWNGVFQILLNVGYTGPLVWEVLPESSDEKSITASTIEAWNAVVAVENNKTYDGEYEKPVASDDKVKVFQEIYNKAELLFSNGSYNGAINFYEKIIRQSDHLSNNAHWARFKIAYIYQKIGEPDKAREVWSFLKKNNKLAIFDGMAEEVLRLM
jgi:sugar phosphate isomerase/epimerase